MRTTVDIDATVLNRARRASLRERRTLGSLVSDALSAYLGAHARSQKDPPFDLLVRGSAGARFPTPEEVTAIEDGEELATLRIRRRRSRAAP